MLRRTSVLAMAATVALATNAALPASAEAGPNDLFAVSSEAPIVWDDELAEIHGRYIVAPSRGVAVNAAVNRPAELRTVDASRGVTSQNVGGPSLDVHGPSGPIVYFGFAMHSEWQSGAGPYAATYSAGVGIGADLRTQHVSVTTWSVQNGTTGAAPGTSPNTIDGGIAPGTVGGVAQTIQIAGNDNAVANHASVDVGPSALVPVLIPTGGPCGSACSVTLGAHEIGVSITTPAGSAAQAITAGAVSQSVKVMTDFNQVANTLHLQVQTGTPSFSPTSLLPTLLQTQVLHR